MSLSPPRENTLGRVTHPDHLTDPQGVVWSLIDDPTADRIAKGDPTFGWEGDERYALYFAPRVGLWCLYRYESDGVYRPSVTVPGFVPGVEVVAWLIRWIVDHDGRRGFNPAEFVIQESIRHQRERDRAAHERNTDAADRLHHGLVKDVGHMDGLTHRQYPSAEVPSSPEPVAAGEPTKE